MWICPNCGRSFKNTNQNHFCSDKPATIAAYISRQDESIQTDLNEIYHTIKTVLPDAEERMSWQMPTFWRGHNLIHFAAQKKHAGIYPGEEAVEQFKDRLTEKGYKFSKGTVQMPYGKVDLNLIREIAEWCNENG